ncbi:MAG: hypothetical protein CBD32_04230 [Actinobacteria bacterium TMED172]|nr:MAG: hypothetical protein CBD32_04230 [Actinobacteria bacterium TMED172]
MGYSITQLREEYAEGSLTPTDAVEACFRNIEELDPQVRAWQSLYQSAALLAAQDSTQRLHSGVSLGPFDGVPFALKDILEIEGEVTTAGCAEWIERRSTTTAEVAKRLLRSGGILLGKTKTVEFAMGGWGTNQRMGTPHNPWDDAVQRTPGGSSSGSGAAVASGMVPCAIGTDTGGSVRLPAAFCGIVGLKTTEGLIPTNGIVPLSHTLDTPGPMARSVSDAVTMFEAMVEHPSSIELPEDITGLKIGYLSDGEREGIEKDQLDAYDNALRILANLGATLVEFDPPKPFEDMKEATFVIVTAEGYFHHKEIMNEPEAKVDENVRKRFLPGASISSTDYVAALLERQMDCETFLQSIEGVHALVTPTTPMLPPPVDEANEDSTPARFTRAINYLSMCATSIPSGVTDNQLPTSIQIACRGGDEITSLQIAAAYETARGELPAPTLYA